MWPVDEAQIEEGEMRAWTVTKSEKTKGKIHPAGHFTETSF